MTTKPNIRNLSKADLTDWFTERGEKAFRARQAWEWLWSHHAGSFEEMTSLSKNMRAQLKDNFSLPFLSIDTVQQSSDGTVKTRFRSDRKSTRLNSSHVATSYAVFCL